MPLGGLSAKVFFDRRDYELLGIVNDVLSREDVSSLKRLMAPYLHPHGIKEMAASRGLRIAYAVIHLFRSLERGKAAERLQSLRALRDEVLYSSETALRKNTARVLLQIMKELVRSEDELQQLQLANDFRRAATGKPRVIAGQLKRFHLLEMPEEWNQIAFDDHVHDANTKGRKSATHLIMDAWIKGIRRLTVIYYNQVHPEVAQELMEAATIMDLEVRVGIEFSARHRGKYVRLIWTPRGFHDSGDFVDFLGQPETRELMAEGKKASQYQQSYILEALDAFNRKHRTQLNQEFGVEMDELTQEKFFALVGTGQPSLHHLGKLVHDHLLPLLHKKTQELRTLCTSAEPGEREQARELVDQMNRMDIETIIQQYLHPSQNPDLFNPFVPHEDDNAPELLRLAPCTLLEKLTRIHSGYRITLNLSNLKVEDVLELLYTCKGMITHLEIFNFKDFAYGRANDTEQILKLQAAINSGNVVRMKKFVRELLHALQKSDLPDALDRCEVLNRILFDLETFRKFYRKSPLKSRIGTDSTGGSCRVPGMGLVVRDTLPHRTQKELDRTLSDQFRVPVSISVAFRRTYCRDTAERTLSSRVLGFLRSIPGLRRLGAKVREDWAVTNYTLEHPERSNIRVLGGVHTMCGNNLALECTEKRKRKHPPFRYMNSSLKNGLKILLGFIPAFVSFYLTKDWWVLAYMGAFIWFGITGIRNIIQSVLGSGGIRRSPLLRWNDYVSWSRLSDSLLYTGFSVPLLDYLVKTLLLEQSMNITAGNNPLALYSIMALVNGIYITSHNLFRGLPKAAAYGNLFRTVLSIPLALVFNAILGALLGAAGVVSVAGVLQRWAAIISKLASDVVAGFIEGLADRRQNERMRTWDFQGKLGQLYDTYAKLEMLYPRDDLLKILESPKDFIRTISREQGEMERVVIIHALDLMYFWMYQPRSRSVLRRFLEEMTQEERTVFLLSQYVLQREKEISQLFLDGLVGRNFPKPLSFYLARSQEYLDDLHQMALRYAPAVQAAPTRKVF
ncbi:MAG: hypothetical protein ACLFTB_06635 [Desulfovibrionales bacterium]